MMRVGSLCWRSFCLGVMLCGLSIDPLAAQDADELAIPIRKGEEKVSGSDSTSQSGSDKSSRSSSSSSGSSSKEPKAEDNSRSARSDGSTSGKKTSVKSSESDNIEARESSGGKAESTRESRSEFSSSGSAKGSQKSSTGSPDPDLAVVNNLKNPEGDPADSSTVEADELKTAAATVPETEQNDNTVKESATQLVSVPGPATALPEVPFAATPAAPQPNLYVPQTEQKRGILSRLFSRNKVTPESPARVPTNFTSDYTKRNENTVLPAVLSGNGINGKDLPIGGEDSYRLASALPTDFRPTDLVQIPVAYCHYKNQLYLRSEAAAALCSMIYDAQCQGLNIKVVSAYRDYSHQLRLYNQSVARRGPNQKTVAKPGKSEHFLGTTVDVTNSEQHALKRSFGETPEGRWLAANAHRYGWKMTVMAGEGRRSHNDEPWHIRYLGSSVNTYSRNSAVAQTQPEPQPRDVMGKIGRFLGLRR